MTEQELKELEELARAAMEQHPEESEDMLERALLDRKQEIWATIRKKARRRVLMRRARPWIASAAMLMAAILVIGVIGVSQARAGKEGLLVDIVENVAGDIRITLSESPLASVEPENFEHIDIENGTWEQIEESVDPRIRGLLPDSLPAIYEFDNGIYKQPSYNMFSLYLIYRDTVNDDYLVIQYIQNGLNSSLTSNISVGTDSSIDIEIWDGVTVYIIRDGDKNSLLWEKDHIMISAMGQIDDNQMREIFNCIAREP